MIPASPGPVPSIKKSITRIHICTFLRGLSASGLTSMREISRGSRGNLEVQIRSLLTPLICLSLLPMVSLSVHVCCLSSSHFLNDSLIHFYVSSGVKAFIRAPCNYMFMVTDVIR